MREGPQLPLREGGEGGPSTSLDSVVCSRVGSILSAPLFVSYPHHLTLVVCPAIQDYYSTCSYNKVAWTSATNIIVGPIDLPCSGNTSYGLKWNASEADCGSSVKWSTSDAFRSAAEKSCCTITSLLATDLVSMLLLTKQAFMPAPCHTLLP